MKKYLFFVLLSAYCLYSYAQNIVGIVIDANTKETIPNATIYYNQTFKGTISDKDGYFELKILENGSSPLVVSAIGYYSKSYIKYSTSEIMKISLEPKIYDLDEVSISAESLEKIRRKNLRIFKNQFLGTTSNAKRCEILNDEDITFNYSQTTDTIKAFAMKPIIIANYALGYKIVCYLNKFEYFKKTKSTSYRGTFIFDEDLQSSAKSKTKYEANREYSYYGSRMHFIRSLFSDSLFHADFQVRNQQYDTLEIVDLINIDTTGHQFLKNADDLLIRYDKINRSIIRFKKDSVYIDESGYFDPDGINWTGDMGSQRMADCLPYEFIPHNNNR